MGTVLKKAAVREAPRGGGISANPCGREAHDLGWASESQEMIGAGERGEALSAAEGRGGLDVSGRGFKTQCPEKQTQPVQIPISQASSSISLSYFLS